MNSILLKDKNSTKYLIIILLSFLICKSHAQSKKWEKCDGLYGGCAKTLLKVDSMLFTGVFKGGVYRSFDTARNWENPSDDNFYKVTSLENKGNLLFAVGFYEGIYRSDDFGETWEQINVDPLGTWIFPTEDTIFLCCDFGVRISTDNGDTWQPSNEGFPNNILVYHITSGNNNYYVGTNEGIFYSKDGTYWNSINGNLPEGQSVYRVHSTDKGLFISNNYKGIYYSSDHGQYWELRNNGLPNYFASNFFNENDTALFLCTDRGLYYTKDLGLNWKKLNKNLPNTAITDFIFFNDEIWISSEGGIFRLNSESDKWEIWNNNIRNSRISALYEKQDTLVTGTYFGIQYSHDNGDSWNVMFEGLDFGRVWALTGNKNTLLALVDRRRIYKTNKLGSRWQDFSNGINSDYIWHLHTVDSTFIALTNSGFYSCKPNDTTWKPTGTFPFEHYICEMTTIDNEIYVGNIEGIVYWSDDLCNTWHQCSNIEGDNLLLHSLTAGDSTVYAGCDNSSFFKYIKEKDVWEYLHVSHEYYTLYLAEIKEPIIFVFVDRWGLDNKPFLSLDNGLTFNDISDGVDFGIINGSALSIHKNALYLGTNANSVWKMEDFLTYKNDHYISEITPEISIYPNPSTDKAYIKANYVIYYLAVYNNSGLLLINKKINSNFYKLNTSNLVPGIYYIKVKTSKGINTKKIIVR